MESVQKRMKSRQDKYLVGYALANHCAYGVDVAWPDPQTRWAIPMTRKAAEALLASMPCAGAVLFELKPIKVNR